MKTTILVTLAILVACSCTKRITFSRAGLSEKDSVLIENNTRFSKASIVGPGAIIAKIEKDKILKRKLKERDTKLREIDGITISTYFDSNGVERTKVTVQNEILFKTNSIEINEKSQKMLTRLYQIVSELPGTRLSIIGHTDNVGTADYNMTLSLNRALSVSQFIKNLGFPSENIAETGKGLTEPTADNSTSSGRAKNRRVEIDIIDSTPTTSN